MRLCRSLEIYFFFIAATYTVEHNFCSYILFGMHVSFERPLVHKALSDTHHKEICWILETDLYKTR